MKGSLHNKEAQEEWLQQLIALSKHRLYGHASIMDIEMDLKCKESNLPQYFWIGGIFKLI